MNLAPLYRKALAVIGIVLALTGCSSGPEPSTLHTPNVVWPSGAPTGPFEATDAVKAFRAEQIAEAVAWNAMDFSDPSFVELLGWYKAKFFAETRLSWQNDYTSTGEAKFAREAVLPGPEPTTILHVIDQGDGVTNLIVCRESRLVDSGRRTWSWIVTSRGRGRFLVELQVGYRESQTDEAECDAAIIPVANFDPSPEPVLDPDAKVIGPADKSKYDFN